MKLSTVLLASALFLALLQASARAEPVTWTYDARPKSIVLLPEHNGTGGVAFTREPTHQEKTSYATVILTYLSPFSAATRQHPDVMIHQLWQLTLNLRDGASGVRGSMHFAGYLSGSQWVGGESLSNHFVGPTTSVLHLGHEIYTVSLTSSSYKAPVGTNPGTISATVSVRHNPEPSTLVLAGLGVSALGGVAWRRWRRRATLPPPSPA